MWSPKLSVSLPKNVNYGRNAMGRLSSTILRNNRGIEVATEKKAVPGSVFVT